MLAAQRVQRLRDDLGPDEGARGDNEYGRMREREALGRDHAAEVDLVTDDDVRPILGAQREDAVRPSPRDAVGEAVAQNQILPFRADLEQRRPLGRRISEFAGIAEHGEPACREARGDRPPAGERHGMTGGNGCARDRDEWIGMAATAGEREQDAHRGLPSRVQARSPCHARLMSGSANDGYHPDVTS